MLLWNAMLAAATFALGLQYAARAEARVICTIVAEASSDDVPIEDGDCTTRVTPASTFKVPLAIMGFDAGFLVDAGAPVLEIRPGEPDWGGAAWRRPVNPRDWIRNSVVWYSQRIAAELGQKRLEAYAASFGYGNADLSGDPGKDNGLQRGWISSSLKISPREQTAFLRRLVDGTLPASSDAIAKAAGLLESNEAGGWHLHGKTGSAFPRKADGSFDRRRGWGWYVGWAERDGRVVTFAYLAQDDGGERGPAGLRARSALLDAWPKLAERLPR